MNTVNFATYLVTNIVNNPEGVSVKEFTVDDSVVIEIIVSEDDMGRVIGKKGRIANSIKTLIQTNAYIHGNKNIKVHIDCY